MRAGGTPHSKNSSLPAISIQVYRILPHVATAATQCLTCGKPTQPHSAVSDRHSCRQTCKGTFQRHTDTDAWFIVKATGIEKGGIGGGVMGVGGGGWEGATVSQLGRDEGSVILKFNIKRQPSNA